MKRYIIIFAGLLLCTVSCNKINRQFNLQIPAALAALVDSANFNNYVAVSYKHIWTPGDSAFHVNAYAGFVDSATGATLLVQNVYVNNNQLTGDSSYSYDYDTTSNAGKNLVGANSSVKITGTSSADTLTSSIYVPSDIGRSLGGSIAQSGTNFSKPFTLTWTPDAQASSLNVVIMIYYFAGLSQANDSTLPPSMNTLTYFTSDNGSFTVPVGDIDTIPVHSVLGMMVSRISQHKPILPVSRKPVLLAGISEADDPPFVVDTL